MVLLTDPMLLVLAAKCALNLVALVAGSWMISEGGEILGDQ
jgi:hypothetical protein